MNDTGNMEHKLDFKEIYTLYFPKLVRFSTEYVSSREEAENIVQDVFFILWQQKSTLGELRNINAYLFKLTKNKCIDFLRHKIRIGDKHSPIHEIEEKELQLKECAIDQFDEYMLSDEAIELLVDKAINSLPPKCRAIFVSSRLEGMKYQEIADQLNLSTNTISNQIAIAMRKLKAELKDYLPLFLVLITGLNG